MMRLYYKRFQIILVVELKLISPTSLYLSTFKEKEKYKETHSYYFRSQIPIMVSVFAYVLEKNKVIVIV